VRAGDRRTVNAREYDMHANELEHAKAELEEAAFTSK
jgi:hypothetical protein